MSSRSDGAVQDSTMRDQGPRVVAALGVREVVFEAERGAGSSAVTRMQLPLPEWYWYELELRCASVLALFEKLINTVWFPANCRGIVVVLPDVLYTLTGVTCPVQAS